MNEIPVEMLMDSEFVLYGVVALLVLVLLLKGIKVVPEGRAKIVERLGRRSKTIYPGINIIIPFVDRVKISVFLINSEQARSNGISFE